LSPKTRVSRFGALYVASLEEKGKGGVRRVICQVAV